MGHSIFCLAPKAPKNFFCLRTQSILWLKGRPFFFLIPGPPLAGTPPLGDPTPRGTEKKHVSDPPRGVLSGWVAESPVTRRGVCVVRCRTRPGRHRRRQDTHKKNPFREPKMTFSQVFLMKSDNFTKKIGHPNTQFRKNVILGTLPLPCRRTGTCRKTTPLV